MEKRPLGSQGLTVSAIGLGCMGMAGVYGTADRQESLATLHRALDIGVNFWDTADMYGRGSNEELLSEVLRERRVEVTLASKFGYAFGPGGERLGVRGDAAYVRQCCDASLRRLGVDTIDLYYQHRVDPKVPIEETVGAMAELVAEGKVRYLGLSEAGADTIRRAAAVHPISALQTEYSIWSREPETGLLELVQQLKIGFVAYSPLGRGFLSGAFKSPGDFGEDDTRSRGPRFQGENFAANRASLERLEKLAAKRGITTAQLAIAWVLNQGDGIVPIPGTKRVRFLEDDAAAVGVLLTAEDMAEIDLAFPRGGTAGPRYRDMSEVDL